MGVGGVLLFAPGAPPQNLLQGFDGAVGAALSASFCVYLCLGFAPILVPLREALVRLARERAASPTRRALGGGGGARPREARAGEKWSKWPNPGKPCLEAISIRTAGSSLIG